MTNSGVVITSHVFFYKAFVSDWNIRFCMRPTTISTTIVRVGSATPETIGTATVVETAVFFAIKLPAT
jgi:hypothetical protein